MVNAPDSRSVVCGFESISGSNRFLALLSLVVVALESSFVLFFDDQYKNERKPVSYRRMHVGPNRRHDRREKERLSGQNIEMPRHFINVKGYQTAERRHHWNNFILFFYFPMDKISG